MTCQVSNYQVININGLINSTELQKLSSLTERVERVVFDSYCITFKKSGSLDFLNFQGQIGNYERVLQEVTTLIENGNFELGCYYLLRLSVVFGKVNPFKKICKTLEMNGKLNEFIDEVEKIQKKDTRDRSLMYILNMTHSDYSQEAVKSNVKDWGWRSEVLKFETSKRRSLSWEI